MFMRQAARILGAAAQMLPGAFRVDAREQARAVFGVALGIVLTGMLSRWVGGASGFAPWLAAPIGASAMLVFAMPSSPVAQPWPVVGGNTVSALIGVACAVAIDDPLTAASLAVAAAVAAMFLLRCLHPPGSAVALLAVLTHAGGGFALFPILLNSCLLVLIAVPYNTLTGRRYPHVAAPAAAATPELGSGSRFSPADLDAALVHYNQVLDVSRDDLEELLHHAEAAAYRRNLGELRCRDIMSRAPVAVTPRVPIEEAWTLMRARRVKALPVIDQSRSVVGIVTAADFARDAAARIAQRPDDAAARGGPAAQPGTVAAIMTREVRVASEDSRVIDLLPLFSEGGHHHLPIVGAGAALVGVVTQSDLVRALHRAVRPE